jgi:hypothetical protein
MKQTINVVSVFFVMAVFAFIPPKHNPVGHWRISYSNGSEDYVDFYKGGTFKNFTTEGKLIHQGNYKLDGDVMSINDKEGCGDTYWATYKLTFYSEDSVLNTAIEDSCSGRREAVTGSVLKRLANK